MPLRVAAQLPQGLLVGRARAQALLPIEPRHPRGQERLLDVEPALRHVGQGELLLRRERRRGRARLRLLAGRAWSSGLCGGGGVDAAVRAAAAPDVSSLAGALGGGGGNGGGDNAAAAAAGEGGGAAAAGGDGGGGRRGTTGKVGIECVRQHVRFAKGGKFANFAPGSLRVPTENRARLHLCAP